MMKLQISGRIQHEIINAEETLRFSGSLVMPENCCCLCCFINTGGLFCVS
ncbi:MAG: hypothetical protein ACI3XQ_05130 [Eubacteriales bacterium]